MATRLGQDVWRCLLQWNNDTYGQKVKFLLVLPAILCLGCGNGAAEPPFQLGAIAEDAPPRPEIRILEPGGQVEVGPRGKIDCEVSLTIPEGGALPTFLLAAFRSRNQTFSTYPLVPAEKRGDNRYLFRGKLRAPRGPGKYRLDVDAIYLIGKRESGHDPAGKAPWQQKSRVTETGPEVRVRHQADGRRP